MYAFYAYLLVYKDGTVCRTDNLIDEDFENVHLNKLEIFDISDSMYPLYYIDGEWQEVKISI